MVGKINRAVYKPGALGVEVPEGQPAVFGGSSPAITPGAVEGIIDTSLTGAGGFRFSPDNITPELSAAAYARAAQEANNLQDRTVLAYKYLQEMQSSQNHKKKGNDSMQPKKKAVQTKKIVRARADSPTRFAGEVSNGASLEEMQQTIAKLTETVASLQNGIASSRQKPAKKTAVRTESNSEEPTATKSVFCVLNIPGLSEKPSKPTYRVVFTLPGAGKLTAYYHWVVFHGRGLFLVYDNRFNYGTFFEPPALPNTPITVEVPDVQRSFRCISLDFVNPFGVFQIVNLLLVSDDVKAEEREARSNPTAGYVSDDVLGEADG